MLALAALFGLLSIEVCAAAVRLHPLGGSVGFVPLLSLLLLGAASVLLFSGAVLVLVDDIFLIGVMCFFWECAVDCFFCHLGGGGALLERSYLGLSLGFEMANLAL